MSDDEEDRINQEKMRKYREKLQQVAEQFSGELDDK